MSRTRAPDQRILKRLFQRTVHLVAYSFDRAIRAHD